jgi:hypothetical protein
MNTWFRVDELYRFRVKSLGPQSDLARFRDFCASIWHHPSMDFDRNDRHAIEAALADPNPENRIAMAIADRIGEFVRNLERMATQNGKWPTELLLTKPETAFDDIVIQLTLQTIADELGHVIEVHWIGSA